MTQPTVARCLKPYLLGADYMTPEERGHACAVEVAKRFGEYINHPAIEIIANAIREAVAAAVEPLMADAYRVAVERDRLQAAVAKHHAQRADDRCWLDDIELYKAAGLPTDDYDKVGSPSEMLKNCERFLTLRCSGGGGWKSYAELEERIAELEAALKRFADVGSGIPDNWPGQCSLTWDLSDRPTRPQYAYINYFRAGDGTEAPAIDAYRRAAAVLTPSQPSPEPPA